MADDENAIDVSKDATRRKLVDIVVDTPPEQLSSMTNIQANLVTPLSMTETYEVLTDILKRFGRRYGKWMEKHEEYLKEVSERKYFEKPQKEDFVCPLCIADGLTMKVATIKGKDAYNISWLGKWTRGPRVVQDPVDVDKNTILCFEHAISMVERIEWGPYITDEEVKEQNEEDEKVAVHLTYIYRISLYKHRRSVGGVHRMATVDLAKEEMAVEAAEQEERDPDYDN